MTKVSPDPDSAGICIEDAIGFECAMLYRTAKFSAVNPVTDEMLEIGMFIDALPDVNTVVLISVYIVGDIFNPSTQVSPPGCKTY